MMENPLSDKEGEKKWGPGAEHCFDLGVQDGWGGR